MQPSFEKVHPLSFSELGLGELVSIYSDLCQMGTPPAIVDADELQQDPEVKVSLQYYENIDKKLNSCLFLFVCIILFPGYITWSLQ